eukprot:CAMPEP_0119320880 /NCGR_PEP_ID=MMETSP1333-20130426/53841_1 /TAXON_ID=418940 /ORGANISM="Scyphosphaera apsteinii, Strain RCC1455" /LENGTH=31 /DNA_ID= /DNA_START= /DNA_END= /DNA_ORIENTATION=
MPRKVRPRSISMNLAGSLSNAVPAPERRVPG